MEIESKEIRKMLIFLRFKMDLYMKSVCLHKELGKHDKYFLSVDSGHSFTIFDKEDYKTTVKM